MWILVHPIKVVLSCHLEPICGSAIRSQQTAHLIGAHALSCVFVIFTHSCEKTQQRETVNSIINK